MAGTQDYINPAFPGGAFSYPTPPVGPRAEIFTHRSTGNYYNWTVPPGVTYIKALVVGGGSDGVTTSGGTTSLGQYATATGGGGGANGVFSVTTTRFPQNIGPSFSAGITTDYGAGSERGGQGVVFLLNMVPGTTIRITIGAAGSSGAAGVVVLEY
jgi:hypothetical protein